LYKLISILKKKLSKKKVNKINNNTYNKTNLKIKRL
jgi:hypothetical protein